MTLDFNIELPKRFLPFLERKPRSFDHFSCCSRCFRCSSSNLSFASSCAFSLVQIKNGDEMSIFTWLLLLFSFVPLLLVFCALRLLFEVLLPLEVEVCLVRYIDVDTYFSSSSWRIFSASSFLLKSLSYDYGEVIPLFELSSVFFFFFLFL